MTLETLRKLTLRLGVLNLLRLLRIRLFAKPHGDLYPLRARGFDHAIFLRPHGSDPVVFNHVIRKKCYDVLPEGYEPEFILDCGANAGYTSVFFLNKYPRCRLIAVEPDLGNFTILQKNLEPYADRATAIRTAVWSHPADLRISDELYRDGREWARVVRECRPGETAQMTSTDIGTLFNQSGATKISLLKMDVEKSEKEIFARNFESWLGKVDVIAIELHDEECERVFYDAVAQTNAPFAFHRAGELTIGIRADLSRG